MKREEVIRVYIQKWNKEDAPWQRILADILKKDYQMENCPEILRDGQGKPYLNGHPLHFNVSHSGEYLAIAVSAFPVSMWTNSPLEYWAPWYH